MKFSRVVLALIKQLAEVIARLQLLYYRTVHVWDSREAVNENVQAKLSFRCRGSYHCEEQFWSALVKDQLRYQISRLWQTDQSPAQKKGIYSHYYNRRQNCQDISSNGVPWGTKKFSPLPCPLHSTLGCLLFSIGSSKSSTTLHGEGEDEKINSFSFLSWQNVREALKDKESQPILLPIVAYKAGVLKVKSGA